jgi:adenylate kinase
VPQAITFCALLKERGLPLPVVIHLDVPDEALVGRLTARRQCPECKHIYNVQTQPPKVAGVCDHDGAALLTREDDREDVVRRRLRAYADQTGPILKWFGPSAVRIVDGTRPADAVAQAVERVVLEVYCEVGVS